MAPSPAAATPTAHPTAPAPLTPAVPTAKASITFRLHGETNFGESLKIIGSDACLGAWHLDKAVPLSTSSETYPFWTAGPLRVPLSLEYKYIKIRNQDGVQWEDGDKNRTLPAANIEPDSSIVVDDGGFNCIQPEPFAYLEGTDIESPGSALPAEPSSACGMRVVVFGSSVSAGHKACRCRGWAEMLGEALQRRYGHGFSNVGVCGINTSRGLDLFNEKVAPLQPKIVILAFGLGNEGLPSCSGHERAHVYQGFLARLSELSVEVQNLGAAPVFGGVYPHGNYSAEHLHWLKKAQAEMRQTNVPVLDWLDVLAHPDGSGRWGDGLAFDPSHPNTEGHRRMFASIDLGIFDSKAVRERLEKRLANVTGFGVADQPIFKMGKFAIFSSVTHDDRCVIDIMNSCVDTPYAVNPDWEELQQALMAARKARLGALKQGLYISAETDRAPITGEAPTFLAVDEHGRIESRAHIPADCALKFVHASSLFRPSSGSQVLFYDGNLALIQEPEAFYFLNESSVEYNVHPMWQELRLATRKLPHGLYDDGSGRPFTSAVISEHGLSSRVKVAPRSGLMLRYVHALEKCERVALLPIGDRCSARMLLHKIEYDGPCYPFDLARSTKLGDVSDIIRNSFAGLWDAESLRWDGYQGRLMHTRWQSVSFAHEVEEGDHPDEDLGPVFTRMAKRYSGRAARFSYACKHATRVVFVRTGCADRAEVEDALECLKETYDLRRPELLLISDQSSEEFADLDGVTHVREGFNPDKMYEDEGYWWHCACRFRAILDSVGVTTANLYWCPNNLKEAAQEAKEAPPEKLVRTCQVKTLSHTNLYRFVVPPEV